MQLLASYFNLGLREINAGTAIESKLTIRLNLFIVRDAAIYAVDTLDLDWNVRANRSRYSDSIEVLDQVNTNKSEVY